MGFFLYIQITSGRPSLECLIVIEIIRDEFWIWDNKRQLINEHEQPLQIFTRDEGQVHDFAATRTDPKISRVDSPETVTAEGA